VAIPNKSLFDPVYESVVESPILQADEVLISVRFVVRVGIQAIALVDDEFLNAAAIDRE
jgi:hypothetical protein